MTNPSNQPARAEWKPPKVLRKLYQAIDNDIETLPEPITKESVRMLARRIAIIAISELL